MSEQAHFNPKTLLRPRCDIAGPQKRTYSYFFGGNRELTPYNHSTISTWLPAGS